MSPLPLLGICIPTYKRPDQLRRCVASIIRSAEPHGVPIFVVDDSTDDTNAAAVADLRARYPLVHHLRNPTNLGIDGNICHSVDACEAQHAWIIGEDDRMTPEAVPRVLEALRTGHRPFVYVNYASVDEDLSMVIQERELDLPADVEWSAEEFLTNGAWAMGFIGACVVDRELWSHVRREPYLGTYFAHVGTILEYLKGRSVYAIAQPVVLNRCGSARAFTWVGSTFDVLEGWGRMVDQLGDAYPAKVRQLAKESFRRAHGVGSIRFFCYLRADRALDVAAYERHVRNGPYPIANRLAAWAIARTSPAPFRAARWLLQRARSVRNRRLVGY